MNEIIFGYFGFNLLFIIIGLIVFHLGKQNRYRKNLRIQFWAIMIMINILIWLLILLIIAFETSK